MKKLTTIAGALILGALRVTAHADLLLNGQANQLDAYDLSQEPPARSLFIDRASNGGRDLNAEICEFTVNGVRYILLGEDSGQPAAPPGWGIFELATRRQVGKLVADYGTTAGPENYGCSIEHANGVPSRFYVTQTGDGTFTSANGQLIVFYADSPALDAVFGRRTVEQVCPNPNGLVNGDCSNLVAADSHWCILDGDLRTAGGLARDSAGNLYAGEVTGGLPGGVPGPGRIARYAAGDVAAAACDNEPLDPPLAAETFVQDILAATPVAIAAALDSEGAPTGHWYVTSLLFLPVVNEYDMNGSFVRNIVPPGFGTPFGLTVGPDGTLYVTDLGVGLDPEAILSNPDRLGLGPVGGEGSVLRVRFLDVPGGERLALPPEVLGEGLSFPDGLRVIDALP